MKWPFMYHKLKGMIIPAILNLVLKCRIATRRYVTLNKNILAHEMAC